jgi:hypothetical protein
MADGVRGIRRRMVRLEEPMESTRENERRFRAQLEQALSDIRNSLDALNRRIDGLEDRIVILEGP